MIKIEQITFTGRAFAISVTGEDYTVGWRPSRGAANGSNFYIMTVYRSYESTLTDGYRYGRYMSSSVELVSGLNKGIIRFTAEIDGVTQTKDVEFEFYYDKLAPIPSITNINSNEIYSTPGLYLEATMESYFWDYAKPSDLNSGNVKVYIDGESVKIYGVSANAERKIKIDMDFPQGVHTISIEIRNPFNDLSGTSEPIEFTVSDGPQFNYLPDSYSRLSYDLVFDFELVDAFDIEGPVSIVLTKVGGEEEVILDIKLEKNINNRYFYVFHNIYGYSIRIDSYATNSVGVTSHGGGFILHFTTINQSVLPIFNRTKIIE